MRCFVPDRETWGARARRCGKMGVALLAEPPAESTGLDSAITDDALIAQTLAGNGEAFGTLVGRYERAVYHLAYRTLREGEDAKDAAQEAWVKAYRALGSFRPGAKFSTWIFTICYRVCCDRLAKRKRFTGAEIPDVADAAPGPAAVYEAADDAARLRRAIDALPEKYRAVITLFHLQGKQYEEIAAVLGLPLGTVKTHLFRAKDQLRAALLDSAESDGGTTPRRTTT
jgi:RNA polymerase sigma-70 factor (ECF subfamily)